MDGNIELLKEIYSNAEMGRDSLYHLVKDCADEQFQYAIGLQYGEYNEILNEVERMLQERGRKPKPSSAAKRTGVHASVKFNLMIDKTSSHLAEMILQGSVMGVIDMTRSMREFQNAEEKVRRLAQKLLDTEDRNMAEMRRWL